MKLEKTFLNTYERLVNYNAAFDSTFAVFSYDQDKLLYYCRDGKEYLEDSLRSETNTENANVVPFVPAEKFYPQIIIEAFVGMRQKIDRNGDSGTVYSKSMRVKGCPYDLLAWTTETERYGKICVFTCHSSRYRKQYAVAQNKEWYRELFKHWYDGRLQKPDPRYWKDEMWCTDVRGKTVEEIVAVNAANTPAGHKPISDLLSQVMQPGRYEASEVRTGYPPVCIAALRAPPLDLIFVQRFRLIQRDKNK